MTDTCRLTPDAPDWRAYAAEIRATVLAETAQRPRQSFEDPDDVLGLSDDDQADATGKAPVEVPPVLTHRQHLLVLALAATLGSRQALAAQLDRRGLIVIDDVHPAIMGDILALLPAALPAGYRVARSDQARRASGAVIVVEPGQLTRSQGSRQDQLEYQLTSALMFPAPVILLLPTGIAAAEILGDAEASVLCLRSFDGEIVAEMLALAYPGSDATSLRDQLPSDAQLDRTPILWFMLALRCDSAEAAAALLKRGGWPEARDPWDNVREGHADKAGPPIPDGIRLADLAGLGEAQQIALGITEDLRAWNAGDLAWQDVHRGLLLAGPPGCGKTELARAMAREPCIHLESGSYAEWQAAGHLGQMLKAMRTAFRNAADNAPAVLFIDEIDAFGSRVSTRTNQNQSYDEKVIAGLLELLDGVASREGVVVIGACNDPDRIDPAIRRAGRFDALVHIPRPDVEALATILRQHLGQDLPDVDLAMLGQLALGHSGAECAAAVRTARATARREKRPATEADLRRALLPDHHALPAAMRRRAAIHEAGHAIVLTALDLAVVKALRLGPEGGETLARWHRTDLTAAEAQRHCIGHLSGRAAELLILGEASGGAGGAPDSDLARATGLLLACELTMGLGDQGHLSIADLPDPRRLLDLPPTTRARLQTRLDRAVREATRILHAHRDLLDGLARELEATGFLGEAELEERLGGVRGHGKPVPSPQRADQHFPLPPVASKNAQPTSYPSPRSRPT